MGKGYQLEMGPNFIFIFKKRRYLHLVAIISGLFIPILLTSPFLFHNKVPTNQQLLLVTFIIIPLSAFYIFSIGYMWYKDKEYKLIKENNNILINNKLFPIDAVKTIKITEISGKSNNIYQISLVFSISRITLIHYAYEDDAKDIVTHLKEMINVPIVKNEFIFYFPWRW